MRDCVLRPVGRPRLDVAIGRIKRLQASNMLAIWISDATGPVVTVYFVLMTYSDIATQWVNRIQLAVEIA